MFRSKYVYFQIYILSFFFVALKRCMLVGYIINYVHIYFLYFLKLCNFNFEKIK
jgi:hypothetical protein